MSYASQTEVPSDRTRAEIERTLVKYGATSFIYGWNATGATIAFEMQERRYRFLLPLPDRQDRKFTHTATRQARVETAAQKSWEQATRARWRALLLIVKAKLEAVASGICTLEEEMLPYLLLPGTGGKTVSEHLHPQIERAYLEGGPPPMLALGDGR